MSNANDGGPAFPVLDYRTPSILEHYNKGMTLRDYMTAAALQCLPQSLWDEAVDDNDERDAAKAIAEAAVRVANAVITELGRGL